MGVENDKKDFDLAYVTQHGYSMAIACLDTLMLSYT